MPISCFGVNRTRDEKLVPITRHNGDYIVSERHVMMLTLLKCSPENGPLWVLEEKSPLLDGFYLLYEMRTKH